MIYQSPPKILPDGRQWRFVAELKGTTILHGFEWLDDRAHIEPAWRPARQLPGTVPLKELGTLRNGHMKELSAIYRAQADAIAKQRRELSGEANLSDMFCELKSGLRIAWKDILHIVETVIQRRGR